MSILVLQVTRRVDLRNAVRTSKDHSYLETSWFCTRQYTLESSLQMPSAEIYGVSFKEVWAALRPVM